MFDDGLEGYIGVWDRSSKKESTARDSIAGTVLAIRDEELGVEGEYFPLSSVGLCLAWNQRVLAGSYEWAWRWART